jgi:hypothetical protein
MVGLVYECAPGKVATELLFSHRNDAQLLLTGNAKASRNTERGRAETALQRARTGKIQYRQAINSYEPTHRAIKRIR